MERIATAVGCPNVVDTAHRIYILAVAYNFNKGRRVEYVAATCLYTACRQMKVAFMLIDFSDSLNVRLLLNGRILLTPLFIGLIHS